MNSKKYRQLKALCREEYMKGETDTGRLSARFGVVRNTVRKWIKDGEWDKALDEERNLERQIESQTKRAYLAALRQYNESPGDANLQSLVSLLKQSRKELEPTKELRDYIVKFLDQTTDFMIEGGHETLLKLFQEQVHDLADYLKRRNNG